MTMWRPVPGYEGSYEVSDDGQVRSLPRVVEGRFRRGTHSTRKGVVLRPRMKGGYLSVRLSKKGKWREFPVHRLVLLAFVGPCPKGMFGLHWNGVKDDNHLDNLRYGTRQDNWEDSRRLGERGLDAIPPFLKEAGFTTWPD